MTTGNPTSWYWDFGNGATSTLQNPSTSYFNPGTYTVSLKATNAAGYNTITKTAFITIYGQPTVDFTAPVTSGCTPAHIQFTDQSATPAGTQITAWNWTFGDGKTSTDRNTTHVYTTTGSFTVTLMIQTDKGCTKSITKPYYINATEGVKPAFTYTDPAVCSAPATVSFTNTSTGPGNLSYSWSFANGNTSTTRDASTTYNTNGNYNVKLTVTSDLGCTDSTFRTVVVGKANTDFTVPPQICPRQPVQFINNSDPRPISAYWDFGNGTTDTLKNGITTFQSPGTYTVTLINTYSACVDTLTKTITTSALPTLGFTVSDTGRCNPPLTVNFTNTSNGTSYQWDFGDSTGSTQTNPSHTYTKQGDFDVTLIATGANGCTDTLKKKALIHIRRPQISFPDLPAKGCIPLTVNFSANIISPDSVTTYNWNFGNGSTSTAKNPSHTYTQEGVYNITLTITTRSGCTETYTLAGGVKTGTKPTAAFTSNVTNACADPGIQFINQSTNANEYLWEFSDGSTSSLRDPQQTFIDTGWISVKLIASNNGCTDEVLKNNYAYIRPSVSRFDLQPDCNDRMRYTFTDRSLGANTWAWNFGDGTTYTGQNPPAHIFPGNGTYTVSLTTTNGTCSYTASKTITIKDLRPSLTASKYEGCAVFLPVFYPQSPDPGMMKTWTWDYGDGTTETLTQGNFAVHSYNDPGIYTVTVTSVDSFGCSHTTVKTNFIKVNGIKADFSSTTNAGCKGMTTTFTDSSVTSNGNAIVKWTWDFGDSTSQTFTAPPFQHQYDSVGDYDVKLVVEDASGCRDSITKREFVKVSSVKADWSTLGRTCPGSATKFINKSQSDLPLTYLWDFGNGVLSNEESPLYAYPDSGLYTVKLKITDLVGCTDSLEKIDVVHVALPKASFDANNLISYCTPFEARFRNTSYFYESSYWDLGNGASTADHPINYYSNTGTYTIKLVVTSAGHCKDSTTQTLEVYNPNDGTITYDTLSGCKPQTVNFTAFKPMNARFIWDFGDGTVIDTTSNTISHVYQNHGVFTPKVILKQSEGCVVPLTGANQINIYGADVKFEAEKYLFCDTGYLKIIDSTTSYGPIIKYTWDMGDGTIYNQPVPNHFYSAPGTYSVSLVVESQGGCIDSLRMPIPVKVVESPSITISGDTEICMNELMALQGLLDKPDSSNVAWHWQFPNGNSSNQQNPPSQQYSPGIYTVLTRAMNSSGCFDTVSTSILVHAMPSISLPDTMIKLVGVPVTIPAQYSPGTTSYYWTPGNSLSCNNCPQPVSNTKFTTDYIISTLDSNGCAANDTVRVIVLCQGATIFFPNAFSPNGDGSNDMFFVRGSGLDRVKSLRIFNRWGEVVFEAKDFPVNNSSYGWNGQAKGRQPQPGVYIYQAEVFCENGEVMRFEGNVALIK